MRSDLRLVAEVVCTLCCRCQIVDATVLFGPTATTQVAAQQHGLSRKEARHENWPAGFQRSANTDGMSLPTWQQRPTRAFHRVYRVLEQVTATQEAPRRALCCPGVVLAFNNR
jgi:hypothetical protein